MAAVRVANQLTFQARKPKKIDAFKLNTRVRLLGKGGRHLPCHPTALAWQPLMNRVSARRPEKSSLGALGTSHRLGKRSKGIGSLRSQIVAVVRKKGEL